MQVFANLFTPVEFYIKAKWKCNNFSYPLPLPLPSFNLLVISEQSSTLSLAEKQSFHNCEVSNLRDTDVKQHKVCQAPNARFILQIQKHNMKSLPAISAVFTHFYLLYCKHFCSVVRQRLSSGWLLSPIPKALCHMFLMATIKNLVTQIKISVRLHSRDKMKIGLRIYVNKWFYLQLVFLATHFKCNPFSPPPLFFFPYVIKGFRHF